MIDAQRIDMDVDRSLKARILASIDTLEETSTSTRWEPHALGIGAFLSVALALADRGARVGLFPAHAWLCFMWQLLGAVLSLAGVSVWMRDWAWRSSPLRLAVVTMGGALLAQLWLNIRCPTHDAPWHVFGFHVTGVWVVALLGYLLARVTQTARSE